jgi:hypothetical protein
VFHIITLEKARIRGHYRRSKRGMTFVTQHTDKRPAKIDVNDVNTWPRFDTSKRTMWDLYHVTDAENLQGIFDKDFDPALAGTNSGPASGRIYFTIAREQADVMADQLREMYGVPAIIHLRVNAKLLAQLDPRQDLSMGMVEESMAVKPSTALLHDGLLSIYTDHFSEVPKAWHSRVQKLTRTKL